MATFDKELSVQQQLIMASAIKGKLNKEIAEELKMHPDVVETQIRRVNKKLNTRSEFESALILLADKVAREVAQETAKNVATQIVASVRSLNTV